MENNGTTEILTDDDVQRINNFVEKPNLKLLVFVTLFTVVSYFASMFLKTYVPLIVFAALSALVIIWYFWMRAKINRYIKPGTKKIVRGKIDNKLEKSVVMKHSKNFASTTQTYGFFLIGGLEYMVPYSDYSNYNIGDLVNLSITLFDDIVFKVEEMVLLKN